MNNEIRIDNLTPRQVELLDHMWSLDSMEQVLDWVSTLNASDRIMSQTLMQMLVHEIMEDLVVEDLSLAREYLTKFRQ